MKLPERSSKHGVGKLIGGHLYVHFDYLPETYLDRYVSALKIVQADSLLQHNVIKINVRGEGISFIYSPDFDTADEPSVQYSVTVTNGKVTTTNFNMENPPIYHHKWLFVGADYRGFDVEASTERSRTWLALPNVDKSRIGYLAYWNKNVVPLIGG